MLIFEDDENLISRYDGRLAEQDWAKLTAIAQARLAAEPAIAVSLPADFKFVKAILPYMTASANK
jgi:hypothetical protein